MRFWRVAQYAKVAKSAAVLPLKIPPRSAEFLAKRRAEDSSNLRALPFSRKLAYSKFFSWEKNSWKGTSRVPLWAIRARVCGRMHFSGRD